MPRITTCPSVPRRSGDQPGSARRQLHRPAERVRFRLAMNVETHVFPILDSDRPPGGEPSGWPCSGPIPLEPSRTSSRHPPCSVQRVDDHEPHCFESGDLGARRNSSERAARFAAVTDAVISPVPPNWRTGGPWPTMPGPHHPRWRFDKGATDAHNSQRQRLHHHPGLER